MKPARTAFIIILLLQLSPIWSQSLQKCSDGSVYWLIPGNTSGFAVKLRGDIDLSAQPDILNIDDKALQYILPDTAAYVDDGNDKSDTEILNRYVVGETMYLRERFGENLEVHSEHLTTSDGKEFVLWRYLLPEGSNSEVTSVVFAVILIDKEIFGLGSPQFADLELIPIKNLLTNAIGTVFRTTLTATLCK